MSQIIINGQPLYQVDLPEMTLAQWLALPVAERPKEWIRTDAEYTDIPAENVELSDGTSVEDAFGIFSPQVKHDDTTSVSGSLVTVYTYTATKSGVVYYDWHTIWRFQAVGGGGSTSEIFDMRVDKNVLSNANLLNDTQLSIGYLNDKRLSQNGFVYLQQGESLLFSVFKTYANVTDVECTVFIGA